MSRDIGTFQISGNLEVQKAAPLDSRDVVSDVTDLISLPFPYKGMKVSITDGAEEGDYRLIDLDYIDDIDRGWVKIGGNTNVDLAKHITEETTADMLNRINVENEEVRIGDFLYIRDIVDSNSGQWIVVDNITLPFDFTASELGNEIIRLVTNTTLVDPTPSIYDSARKVGAWTSEPYFSKVFTGKHYGATDNKHSYITTINGASNSSLMIGTGDSQLGIGMDQDAPNEVLDINLNPFGTNRLKKTPEKYRFLRGTGSDLVGIVNYASIDAGNVRLAGDTGSLVYSPNITGWNIENDGTGELNNLKVRGSLSANEFTINKIKSTNGNMIVSDALIVEEASYMGSGLNFSIKFKDIENFVDVPFVKDDYLLIQQYSPSGETIIKKLVFQALANANTKTHELPVVVTNQTLLSNVNIEPGDCIIRVGSLTNPDRRSTIWLNVVDNVNDDTVPAIDLVQSDQDLTQFGDVTYSLLTRIGNLDDINDDVFGQLSGMGIFTDNGYFKGALNATSGHIANSNIDNDSIWSGNADKTGTPNWILNSDGSGHLAGGAFKWSHDGNQWIMTFSSGVRDQLKGDPVYTWTMYADDENGSNISSNPVNKDYIGLAFNKETETPSNIPADYVWKKIVGTDGDQGPIGSFPYPYDPINPPASGDGFALTDSYFGFYKNSLGTPAWTTYMDNQGNFQLKGDAGIVGPGLYWNAASTDLVVRGTIYAEAGNIGDWDISSGVIQTIVGSGGIKLDATNREIITSSDSNNYVKQFYTSNEDFGLAAVVGGEEVFRVGKKIGGTYDNNFAGWEFDHEKLVSPSGNVEINSNGSITNGLKWGLFTDGSGRLANGNIHWNDEGDVKFTSNVTITLGSLSQDAIDGLKGDQGPQGPPGKNGADSTVPGPQGLPGKDGADGAMPYPNAPTGYTGLVATSTHFGYAENGVWKTYMQNNGNFALSGASGNGLTWFNDVLSIDGHIESESGVIGGFTLGKYELNSANLKIENSTGKIIFKDIDYGFNTNETGIHFYDAPGEDIENKVGLMSVEGDGQAYCLGRQYATLGVYDFKNQEMRSAIRIRRDYVELSINNDNSSPVLPAFKTYYSNNIGKDDDVRTYIYGVAGMYMRTATRLGAAEGNGTYLEANRYSYFSVRRGNSTNRFFRLTGGAQGQVIYIFNSDDDNSVYIESGILADDHNYELQGGVGITLIYDDGEKIGRLNYSKWVIVGRFDQNW